MQEEGKPKEQTEKREFSSRRAIHCAGEFQNRSPKGYFLWQFLQTK